MTEKRVELRDDAVEILEQLDWCSRNQTCERCPASEYCDVGKSGYAPCRVASKLLRALEKRMAS